MPPQQGDRAADLLIQLVDFSGHAADLGFAVR
jgi:hypothetical protein